MGTGLIEAGTFFTRNVRGLLYFLFFTIEVTVEGKQQGGFPPPRNFEQDSAGMFQKIGEICPRATWTGLGLSQGLCS
jgi:hypothetical protein